MGRRGFEITAVLVAACTVAAPAAARPIGVAVHDRHAHHAIARRLNRSQILAFAWPAAGTVTTPFTAYHKGLDIGMLRSLDVHAAAPGKVVSVGYVTGFEGYGNIVVVQVTSDVVTMYAHLSADRVHVGQEVRKGELLGIAGCTGYCTGTHLHFEVRQNGVAVDPRKFLGG
jgi:murein DD-endopeptidase MepM/ murein hydrolase activator NlpD